MPADPPIVVIIGVPNGAGKTTISRRVLADAMGVPEFVNADAIAKGLSAFNPETAAIAAGRVMLARLCELARSRVSFAFESTLASRTLAAWLRSLKRDGYEVRTIYVALRTPQLAIRRVRARVRAGGHSVPDEIVERRFWRSARNFHELYLPLSDVWRIYDNSGRSPRLVADRLADGPPAVYSTPHWRRLQENTHAEGPDQDDPL